MKIFSSQIKPSLTKFSYALLLLALSSVATSALATTCEVTDGDIRGSYTGECQDGKADGRGLAIGKDRYEGEFKHGKKHGQGIYTWADGDRYEGTLKDDKRNGQGVYTWVNGSKYEGEWRDDKRHGLGKLTLTTGDEDIASWEKDDVGEWQGDTYVVQGEFINNNLDLKCQPTRQACDKARAEQEKVEQARLEREYKANKRRARAVMSVNTFA